MSFFPNAKEIDQMASLVKRSSGRSGFIFSIKNTSLKAMGDEVAAIEETISALTASQDNIIVKEWVPQLKIFEHPKTKVFITHCGGNGVTEANYFGISMLGFPQVFEQRAVCGKQMGMGVAEVALPSDSDDQVFEKLTRLMQPEVQQLADLRRREMEFEELRGNGYVNSWANYGARFGFKHLVDPTNDYNTIQRLDYDICLMLLLPVFMLGRYLYKALKP